MRKTDVELLIRFGLVVGVLILFAVALWFFNWLLNRKDGEIQALKNQVADLEQENERLYEELNVKNEKGTKGERAYERRNSNCGHYVFGKRDQD